MNGYKRAVLKRTLSVMWNDFKQWEALHIALGVIYLVVLGLACVFGFVVTIGWCMGTPPGPFGWMVYKYIGSNVAFWAFIWVLCAWDRAKEQMK